MKLSLPISNLGERKVIQILRENTGSVEYNLRDDCAILDLDEDHYLLATTDASYDEQDFPHFATPYEKAWQIVACSLSDIAAMGGTPIGILDCLELSPNMTVDELRSLSRGLNDAAQKFGTKIIGGDVNSADRLGITITTLGKVKKNEVMRREGAHENNSVGVVGNIGDYNAAYFAFMNNLELTKHEKDYFLSALFELKPQIDIGIELAHTRKVTSCIDLNDGLQRGLEEIANSSGVGIDIYEEKLPLTSYARHVAQKLDFKDSEIAINFSGDLNLLITYRNKNKAVIDDVVRKYGNEIYEIGRVNAYAGKVTMDGKRIKSSSFEHFLSDNLFDQNRWQKFQR